MIDQDDNPHYPKKGRTWADVFVGASYLTAGIIFLVGMAVAIYFIVGEIPDWFFLSILASLLFIPFLMERAKDGSELFIVSDDPFKLTEYRVGRRVGLEIQGNGVLFQSNSGIYRTFLTELDVDSRIAKGSPFGDLTQIDQVRDMNTLKRAIDSLEENLRESRISSQEVGIAVEKQSIEIVDWALKTIYGAIIPTEISEAFGIEEEKEILDIETILNEPLEDLLDESP
jgi:hypothetical protein